MRVTRTMVTLLTTLAMGWGTALAQEGGDGGPAVQPTTRDGWTVGLAVGPGELHVLHHVPDADDPDEVLLEGAGVSLRAGKALTQGSLFLVFVDWVMTSEASNTLAGVALQNYLSKRVFTRYGGGIALFHQKEEPMEAPPPVTPTVIFKNHLADDERELSLGGVFAVGVEAIQLRDLAVSVELDINASHFLTVGEAGSSDISATMINVSLMLGAQWF